MSQRDLPLTVGPWAWSGGQLLSQQSGAMYSETVLVVDDERFLPSKADAAAIAGLPSLLTAAKRVLDKLESDTATVTVLDQEALRSAYDACLQKEVAP